MRWLFGLVGLVLWGCAPDLDIEALPEVPERPERIEGIWEGTIDVAGLRVVVHVAHEGGALEGGAFKGGVLSATLDSPDQGAYGIAVDDVRFDGERFALRIDKLGAAYSGTMDATGTRLAGEWHQGMGIDLELVKVDQPSERVRPQTPQPPFPYTIEEVVFPGGAEDVRLAGTLTIPESGAYPTVVLVTGSGPQDRNETLMGHQPFRVLADYLSRHGVAVLRYDDRGVGGSTGDFEGATTLDVTDDAAAAMAYLRTRADVAPHRVGVLGHSEGGLVVADLAARGRDLSCGVMLAGPTVSGEAVHQAQIRLVVDTSSMPIPDSTIERIAALNAALYVAARGSGTWQERRVEGLRRYRTALEEFNFVERGLLQLDPDDTALVDTIVSPWFLHFIDYDPGDDLAAAKVPILALYGELDLQVPPEQSVPVLEAIETRVGRFDIRVLPGLNHLFQTAETGSPEEYARIEETMSPETLSTIGDWVVNRC